MNVMPLLNNELTPELDYLKILELYKSYAHPRDQVTKLIKSKKVIRVKKGIYILGPEFGAPYSREVLANIIYGPSYVSGLSALAFYSLIPERVTVTSSRTPNKKKLFDTPIGRFTYSVLPIKRYCVSIDRIELDKKRSFLIATREKSLVELTYKNKDIRSSTDLLDWINSMRIDTDILAKLRIGEFLALQKVFPA